jgi:hypothetical protein
MPSQYPQTNSTEPVSDTRSQVTRGMDAIQSSYDLNAKLIEELEQKLSRILRSVLPQGEASSGDSVKESYVPLADDLFNFAAYFERSNDRLRSIIQRLEI